jgi:hypothetical protein
MALDPVQSGSGVFFYKPIVPCPFNIWCALFYWRRQSVSLAVNADANHSRNR